MVWPFRQTCDVFRQGEATATLTGIGCTVWRLRGPRQTSNGETYTWSGIASRGLADEVVGKPNRVIVVGGRRLRVMDAIDLTNIPHVELQLAEMRPAG